MLSLSGRGRAVLLGRSRDAAGGWGLGWSGSSLLARRRRTRTRLAELEASWLVCAVNLQSARPLIIISPGASTGNIRGEKQEAKTKAKTKTKSKQKQAQASKQTKVDDVKSKRDQDQRMVLAGCGGEKKEEPGPGPEFPMERILHTESNDHP